MYEYSWSNGGNKHIKNNPYKMINNVRLIDIE